jgi:hypothetical protein
MMPYGARLINATTRTIVRSATLSRVRKPKSAATTATLPVRLRSHAARDAAWIARIHVATRLLNELRSPGSSFMRHA